MRRQNVQKVSLLYLKRPPPPVIGIENTGTSINKLKIIKDKRLRFKFSDLTTTTTTTSTTSTTKSTASPTTFHPLKSNKSSYFEKNTPRQKGIDKFYTHLLSTTKKKLKKLTATKN